MNKELRIAPKNLWGKTENIFYLLAIALIVLSALSSVSRYSVLFLTLSGVLFLIVVFFAFRAKDDTDINSGSAHTLWLTILIAGIFLRIFLAIANYGYPTDIGCFTGWAKISYTYGLDHFYTSGYFTDYPPLYMYVLYFLGAIEDALHISNSFFLIKIPAIICDILVALLAYRMAKKLTNEKCAMFAFVCILLNPAVIANSAVWGQIDMIYTLPAIFCIYLLMEHKITWAIIIFVLSVLLKVQSILLFPLILFVVIKGLHDKKCRKNTLLQLLAGIGIGAGLCILLILPFTGDRPLTWIVDLYLGSIGGYNYAAVNAFNLFGLLGLNWAPLDTLFLGLSYKMWGIIGIAAAFFYSTWLYCKKPVKELYFGIVAFLIFGVYIFGHSMHERYTFAVPVLLLFSYIFTKDKKMFFSSLGTSLTVLLNQYVALYYYDQYIPYPIMLLLSACNIVVFIYTAYSVTAMALGRNHTKEVGLTK